MEKLSNDYYSPTPGTQKLEHYDEAEIRALLLGRRVVEVDDDHLRLDNGTVVRVLPHEGGCSCDAGDYYLESLNRVDNVITKVEFDREDKTSEDGYEERSTYRIFIFADNERINLLEIEGTDGNGYYGTGYDLLVKPIAAVTQ